MYSAGLSETVFNLGTTALPQIQLNLGTAVLPWIQLNLGTSMLPWIQIDFAIAAIPRIQLNVGSAVLLQISHCKLSGGKKQEKHVHVPYKKYLVNISNIKLESIKSKKNNT